jgi:tetratricopeptide (TPR) repeat protein
MGKKSAARWSIGARWRAHRNYFEGWRLLGRGRPGEAVKAFDRVLGAFPRHARAHGLRALALAAAGRSGEAVGAARKAAELAPHSHAPALFLGQIQYDAGHYEEARKAFSAAARLDPENRLVQAHLGLTLVALGLAEQGAELLREHLPYGYEEVEGRTLALAEEFLWRHRGEARSLEEQLSPDEGGREEAPAGLVLRLTSAIRMLTLWPLARLRGRKALLWLRAEEAMSLGDWGSAITALREAEQAGADTERSALALGQAYLEVGKPGPAAEQLVGLSEQKKQEPEIAALLGFALFEAGRYEEAKRPLETAAARFSREYPPCYYRGLCEIALGKARAAVPWFVQAAARLNPQIAEKRLEEMMRLRAAGP